MAARFGPPTPARRLSKQPTFTSMMSLRAATDALKYSVTLPQNWKRKPTVGSMVDLLRKPLARPFETCEYMAPA